MRNPSHKGHPSAHKGEPFTMHFLFRREAGVVPLPYAESVQARHIVGRVKRQRA